jgi:hypothetical protein
MFRRFAIPALFALASLEATTLERLSIDGMVEKSTAIVRARVLSNYGEFRNGSIFTHYRVLIQESWKGNVGVSKQTDLYVPGGSANGMRQSIPGAPILENGEEYVLFLWAGTSGRNQIIGLSQGLFSLVREEDGSLQLERPGAKEMMLDAKTGRPVLDTTVRMPFGELKTRVVTKLMELQAQSKSGSAGVAK